jgi:penicillin-binding protein 2
MDWSFYTDKNETNVLKGDSNENSASSFTNKLPVFLLFFLIIGVLLGSLFNLQVIENSEYMALSENNSLKLRYIYPERGVIYDRNGEILAENVPSTDLYLNISSYNVNEGELEKQSLDIVIAELEDALDTSWLEEGEKYDSLEEKIISQFNYLSTYRELARISGNGNWTEENSNNIDTLLTETLGDRWLQLVTDNGEKISFNTIWREIEDLYYQKEVVIARNLENEQTIKIKSLTENLVGLRLDESTKRYYPKGEAFSHILGYTGAVYQEDWNSLDYVGLNDVIGKTGVEKIYDRQLIGEKGLFAFETDAIGNALTEGGRVVENPIVGKNLTLTVDSKAQEKMYEMIKDGVADYDAVAGVGIIQEVDTGEIIVMASYPSFDNNDYIAGLSEAEYKVLSDPIKTPTLNRAIAAQLPPGSTFKTIAAAAALDAGAITTSTIYTSKAGYEFSNGAPFQEFQGHVYGPLNVREALMLSSNIYFCETIRNWDIDEYVEYLEAFGIGSVTGIDLLGEAPGRLPSPENKIAYASLPGVTWLDPIWYPEGDGCNTVIGQGITNTTPLQMVNWISAIANGGTLNTPHLGDEFSGNSDVVESLKFDPLNEDVASSSALQVVREGMRLSVNGARSQNFAMRGNRAEVAAKTGTAEFGKLNSDGIYEHTHAWITGFWPYNNPKYSFVILLEDGGGSFNAGAIANEYTNWWIDEME